jgi:hypothetical protein
VKQLYLVRMFRTCGPPQNYEMGDEGYWDVECLIEDGAGASVLVRFNGHHVADYEVIV